MPNESFIEGREILKVGVVDSGDDRPLDTVYELLANHRRRYALSCLNEHANPMSLADLADEVAVRENGTSTTEVSDETIKDIYISLYHVHIPKLEEANVVRYDQEEDTVALSKEARR